MAADLVCDSCGATNPPGTQFCTSCNAFLSWDGTTDADRTQVITAPGDQAPSAATSRQGRGTSTGGPTSGPHSAVDPSQTVRLVGPGTGPTHGSVGGPVVGIASGATIDRVGGESGDVGYRIIQPGGAEVSAPEVSSAEIGSAEGGSAEPTPAEPPFEVVVQPIETSVLPALPPAVVEVTVDNVSGIVEAYAIDVPDAPAWLDARAAEVSLLPGTSDSTRLSLTAVGPGLIPAQRLALRVRVRARSDARLVRWVDLAVVVPPVDGPITLSLVPSLVRMVDRPVAEATLRAENRTGNRPVRLTLSASDPEARIRFTFQPPAVEIPPGGETAVRLIIQAPAPQPGKELSQTFTITAADSSRTVSTTGSLVQSSSAPVIDPPLGVRLEPSLLRVTNSTVAELAVVLDNSKGRFPAAVRLSGSDPELAIRFAFDPPVFTIPPGGTVSARVRLEAAPPTPGGESNRPFTITASVADRSGARNGTANGSFVQVSTPLVAIALRVAPAVVRVGGGSARFGLTVDNRGGMTPVRVTLAGSDPEGVTTFEFSPPTVDLPPGGAASVSARVRAPRAERGAEVTRELDFWADDGRAPARERGTLIQSSASLRPMLRVLLTLLGAAAMIGGCFLDWTVRPPFTAVDWTVPAFGRAINEPNIFLFDDVARALPSIFFSAAIVVLVLAAVVLFGLTGKTGRLTRIAAVVCALFVVAFLMALHFRGASGRPGIGSITVIAGCVCAFCGGLMARR